MPGADHLKKVEEEGANGGHVRDGNRTKFRIQLFSLSPVMFTKAMMVNSNSGTGYCKS